MVKDKPRKIVKCEGRFHEFRDSLYTDAFPLVLGDSSVLSEDALKEVWELVKEEAPYFDSSDPYFNASVTSHGKRDTLRKVPTQSHLSLVPLIESPALSVEDAKLITNYALGMGNNEKISKSLADFVEHPRNYLETSLGRSPSSIRLLEGKNLAGYIISADYGVGTIVSGGAGGGGIRADSPFLLGVYEQPHRGELNLAAVIGFWAQDNNMLVSQMQSCGNGHFPSETKFGTSALSVAEAVAKEIGFNKILTYSARNHPVFVEHPEDWGQFGEDFVCIYDNSAKKHGFNGGRHGEVHEKVFSVVHA